MTLPSFSLEDQVALITGGSRGLGKTLALAFAEAGADVGVCARSLPELEEVAEEVWSLGRRSLAIQANVGVKEDVDNMVNRMLKEFGTVDILVNNAAMNIARPLMELREDGWDKVVNTDLKGPYLCSQAAGRAMVERKRGNIINITTVGAVRAEPGLGVYSVVKAGLDMLTRVLALELAPYNIRVNAIGPTMMKTRFSEPLWSRPGAQEKVEARVPLGRLGETSDVVGAALFLASDASSFVTGHTIYVDGGLLAK